MDTKSVITAVIKGNVVLCGKCGHKIADCDIKKAFGNKIWLLCKHKSINTKWDKCMTLNEVVL